MNPIFTSLLQVDLSNVPASVSEGLRTGTMTLSSSNGNVYWAEGSGHTGIVKQLPLKQVNPDELAKANDLLQLAGTVKVGQAATMVAIGVSTVVVLAAVAAATKYLAAKIDRLQTDVAGIAGVVGQQDQREYVDRISDYTSAVTAAQKWIRPGVPRSEVAQQLEQSIGALSQWRHKTLDFVHRLRDVIDQNQPTSPEQYGQALQYMTGILDWIPVALFVERELCMAAEKPRLAHQLRIEEAQQYRSELAIFRTWCDAQYAAVAKGESDFVDQLVVQRGALEALFNSPTHSLLLDGLRVADFAAAPAKGEAVPADAQAGTTSLKTG
jgi:hypothetical protein